MMKNFRSKKYGFTLVETMVAIAILSMAILGTFTAVQTSLQDSSFAQDQVTAFYLVQEAVEYVRNVRDTNALHNIATPGPSWLTGLSAVPSDPCYFGKVCTINALKETATTCLGGAGTCGILYEDPSSGVFGYNSAWTPTHFTREISLQKISDNEVIVNVTISWTSGRFSKSFTVQEDLFNWH